LFSYCIYSYRIYLSDFRILIVPDSSSVQVSMSGFTPPVTHPSEQSQRSVVSTAESNASLKESRERFKNLTSTTQDDLLVLLHEPAFDWRNRLESLVIRTNFRVLHGYATQDDRLGLDGISSDILHSVVPSHSSTVQFQRSIDAQPTLAIGQQLSSSFATGQQNSLIPSSIESQLHLPSSSATGQQKSHFPSSFLSPSSVGQLISQPFLGNTSQPSLMIGSQPPAATGEQEWITARSKTFLRDRRHGPHPQAAWKDPPKRGISNFKRAESRWAVSMGLATDAQKALKESANKSAVALRNFTRSIPVAERTEEQQATHAIYARTEDAKVSRAAVESDTRKLFQALKNKLGEEQAIASLTQQQRNLIISVLENRENRARAIQLFRAGVSISDMSPKDALFSTQYNNDMVWRSNAIKKNNAGIQLDSREANYIQHYKADLKANSEFIHRSIMKSNAGIALNNREANFINRYKATIAAAQDKKKERRRLSQSLATGITLVNLSSAEQELTVNHIVSGVERLFEESELACYVGSINQDHSLFNDPNITSEQLAETLTENARSQEWQCVREHGRGNSSTWTTLLRSDKEGSFFDYRSFLAAGGKTHIVSISGNPSGTNTERMLQLLQRQWTTSRIAILNAGQRASGQIPTRTGGLATTSLTTIPLCNCFVQASDGTFISYNDVRVPRAFTSLGPVADVLPPLSKTPFHECISRGVSLEEIVGRIQRETQALPQQQALSSASSTSSIQSALAPTVPWEQDFAGVSFYSSGFTFEKMPSMLDSLIALGGSEASTLGHADVLVVSNAILMRDEKSNSYHKAKEAKIPIVSLSEFEKILTEAADEEISLEDLIEDDENDDNTDAVLLGSIPSSAGLFESSFSAGQPSLSTTSSKFGGAGQGQPSLSTTSSNFGGAGQGQPSLSTTSSNFGGAGQGQPSLSTTSSNFGGAGQGQPSLSTTSSNFGGAGQGQPSLSTTSSNFGGAGQGQPSLSTSSSNFGGAGQGQPSLSTTSSNFGGAGQGQPSLSTTSSNFGGAGQGQPSLSTTSSNLLQIRTGNVVGIKKRQDFHEGGGEKEGSTSPTNKPRS
jgi:hypothetical protein